MAALRPLVALHVLPERSQLRLGDLPGAQQRLLLTEQKPGPLQVGHRGLHRLLVERVGGRDRVGGGGEILGVDNARLQEIPPTAIRGGEIIHLARRHGGFRGVLAPIADGNEPRSQLIGRIARPEVALQGGVRRRQIGGIQQGRDEREGHPLTRFGRQRWITQQFPVSRGCRHGKSILERCVGPPLRQDPVPRHHLRGGALADERARARHLGESVANQERQKEQEEARRLHHREQGLQRAVRNPTGKPAVAGQPPPPPGPGEIIAPPCNGKLLANPERMPQPARRRFKLLHPMIAVLIVLGVLLLVAIVLGLWVAGIYNSLVTLRNRFKNAFAQIDVQLKRRYDLIPNLVEVAKGYMKHESGTLEAVIKARNVAYTASQAAAANPADAGAVKNLLSAETGLAGAMSRLMVVSEQYPDLKANQNMMQLTEEMTSTENKISFARQAYNDSVMTYNTARESFPTNILAGMFNFAEAQLFQIENAAERAAPQVKF